jgi:hypothetical protein
MSEYKLQGPPQYVGKWRIACSDLYLSTVRKPNWFHRLMMRVLIGWTWSK